MLYYSNCYCAAAAAGERIGASGWQTRAEKKAGARRAAAISLFSLLVVVDFVRTWMDGEGFLFLSFSQEGSPREFFSLFYLVCTRLSVLALGSPRRSHGPRARPATSWTRVISSAIPCPSRGNASAIRNISEQRRGGRTTPVRLDSRHRMWLSVALSMAGWCRVQIHRLLVRMRNKNRCNSMLHQVKYILLFVLSYFMSWTYLSWWCALCVLEANMIECNEEYRIRNSSVETEI